VKKIEEIKENHYVGNDQDVGRFQKIGKQSEAFYPSKER